MCGLAGYYLKTPSKKGFQKISLLMDGIRHRGPDDEGICLINKQTKKWYPLRTDKTVPALADGMPHFKNKLTWASHDIALIHSRYSIIDLSEGGHQPFISADSSVICAFNGEIYNYLELRDELSSAGISFRTSSDTEVLVEGYRYWGHEIWEKMNGFWALSLFDLKKNTLILARDRMGIAPLYFRQFEDGVYFASTIRSLLSVSQDDVELDSDVLVGFIQTGIKDHDCTTCYSDIKSVPQATAVEFSGGCHKMADAKFIQFWSFPKNRLNQDEISFKDAVRILREKLFDAVKLRLRSDVKLAFELSGGLDSSSVVAIAAELTNSDITTYTIRVPESNEEPFARAILDRYPVKYRVLDGLEGAFSNELYDFSRIMEEPYHSPNIYTHYRMRKIMKENGISVVIMGAGGDECLGGYESSFWLQAYREMKRSGFFWQADFYEFCRRYKTFQEAKKTIKHYFLDFPRLLGFRLVGNISNFQRNFQSEALNRKHEYDQLQFHQRCLYHFNVALIPYYMRSNDHFTMAIPLEHRFPFLDYKVVEFCLRLPIAYLYKNGWTKYILRKAMEPYLPKKILWRRKKMGFPFPYKRFLQKNQNVFEPLLNELKSIELPFDEFEEYSQLIEVSPVLLWRLISTGIWVKHNLA